MSPKGSTSNKPVPPKAFDAHRLVSLTLAAQQALDQEDWKLLQDLLDKRADAITQIESDRLTPTELKILRHVQALGHRLADTIAERLKDTKAVLSKETHAQNAVKNYSPAASNSTYNLTG